MGIKKIQSNIGILIREPIKDFNKKNYAQKPINQQTIKNENNQKIKNSITNNKNEIQNNNNELKSIEEKKQTELLKPILESHKNINIVNKIHNNTNIQIFDKCKPYIRALLVSFYEIAIVKKYFIKEYLTFKTKNCYFSYYVCKFLQKYAQKDYINCDNSILELEKNINKIDINVLKNINFEKLIYFFLNKCHEELNTKQKTNNKAPEEDYDEKISYYNYKKYYYEQNESTIQDYFYGIKENIKLYECCKLTKYSFEIFQYIAFHLDKIEKTIDIQTIIYSWENIPKMHKNFCSMCCTQSDTSINHEIYDNPNILIIIINNIKKIPVKINKIIKTNKNEYKFLCCISEPKNDTKFNIIFILENTWHVIINNDYKEAKKVGSEINSLIQNPCVLFYEKGNQIFNDKKTDTSYISKNTTPSNHIKDNKSIDIKNNEKTQKLIDINKPQNISSNLSKVLNNSHNNNTNNAIYKKTTFDNNINNNQFFINNNQTQYNKMNIPHKKSNNMVKNNSYKFINTNSTTQHNLYKYFFDNINSNNTYNLNYLYNNNNNTILTPRNYNYNNMIINNNIVPQNFQNIQPTIKNYNNNNMISHKLNDHNMINIINSNSINNKNNIILNNTQLKNINTTNFNSYYNNNTIQFKANNNNFNNQNNIPNSNLNTSTIPQNNDINKNNQVYNNKESVNGEMITLYFLLQKYQKELYLDVKESDYFSAVIKELNNKYDWLKNVNILKYQFKGVDIDLKKTVKDIGLKNESKIILCEEVIVN